MIRVRQHVSDICSHVILHTFLVVTSNSSCYVLRIPTLYPMETASSLPILHVFLLAQFCYFCQFCPFVPICAHLCPFSTIFARLVEIRSDRLPRTEVGLQWTNHGTIPHKITHHSLPIVAIYDDIHRIFLICERNSWRTCSNLLAVFRFFYIVILGFRVISTLAFVQILVWNNMRENLSSVLVIVML